MNIKITDNSNDKKYFSIIPNFIINHSDHWEQSLYLVMKRLAGEKGTCFASQLTLAKSMKCSQPKVSLVIKSLEKRGWIKRTGKKMGKTQSVVEYSIVDIWDENINYYKKISTKPRNSLPKHQTTEYLSTKPRNTEEEHIIKKNNNIHEQKVRVRGYKRLPLEKQTIIHRLCYHLEDSIGTKIVNWGKQGRGIKQMMRAGYTEDEIKKVITYMAKSDEFFSDKGFDLVTVSNQIGRYKAMSARRNNQ